MQYLQINSILPDQLLRSFEKNELEPDDSIRFLVKEYLYSSNWKIRNVGVKLVGLSGYTEFLPRLVKMIVDRNPVPWWKRSFGGDFCEVGFIRRNCIRSIRSLGYFSQDVRRAVHNALSDPYWEVRVEALRTIPILFPREEYEVGRVQSEIKKLLNDKSFEVKEAAVLTVGKIVTDPDVLHKLRKLYSHPNLKIRKALTQCLQTLFDRGIIPEREQLEREQENIFVPGE